MKNARAGGRVAYWLGVVDPCGKIGELLHAVEKIRVSAHRNTGGGVLRGSVPLVDRDRSPNEKRAKT